MVHAETTSTPICPQSMLDTADRDPFPLLEDWRRLGRVIRDERIGAWLVFDYELCKRIENDEPHFSGMYVDPSPVLVEIKGGQGNIMLSQGEEHQRLRRLHLKLLSPAAIERYNEIAVKPIIDHCLRNIEGQGHAELASDLAEQIPPRVIFALLGLPWRDDALVQHTLDLHEIVMTYFGNNYPGGEIEQRALAASRELRGILLPYIRRGRSGRGDDLISQIWREAPAEYGEITEDEVVGVCREIFLGGSDTTVHGLANCFHLLLTQPVLHEAVRRDRDLLRRFVEEAMRLYPAPQWRFRIAVEDCELAGVAIKAGDRLLLAHTAANRDPNIFDCPAAADLTRKAPASHLTFNYGSRSCVGAGLARAEMRETLNAALDRLPNLRLDPDAEQPRFRGFFMTSFKPLNVLFDPR